MLMAAESFREQVEKGLGAVVIFAGSGSDEAHIDKIVNGIRKYGLPVEVRVKSAHKQSEELLRAMQEYDNLCGPLVYIAVAGGTDALSGTISYNSLRPTISCPPDHINMSGLTNPLGSSNAYIGRPENAARFIAQMFSGINPYCRVILFREITEKRAALENDDKRLQNKYSGEGVLT